MLLALGCAALLRTQQAPNDAQLVARIETYERNFSANAYVEPCPTCAWFRVDDASSCVLITAPHATAHLREGKYKFPDGGSGSLAIVLHERANVPSLYTTMASPRDANYYDDTPFKERLELLFAEHRVCLVLDLHVARADRPFDVDIGNMRGASLVGHPELQERLEFHLRSVHIDRISRNFFSASKQATVTKFVAARGIPAMQIEVNTRLLRTDQDEGRAALPRLVQALVAFIRETSVLYGGQRGN